MAKTTVGGTQSVGFERLQSQAIGSVRRDAHRVRDLAEKFRELYRERLEDWARIRASLEQGMVAKPVNGSRVQVAAVERMRTHHDQAGRELANLQARLKRLDVAARQLEQITGYLGSADPNAAEPSLDDADESQATIPLRIVQAQEAERQRLAEVVHDGPAQVLTNAIFQVEYLDRVIDDAPRTAHAELAFLRTMLRDGLDEVRDFIADLRPPAVDVGLSQALADQGKAFAERHGIAVTVAVNGIDAGLTPDDKASVLRIVQEALQNVRKHAAATEVRIGMEGRTLVIGDNGRGFDVMRLASGASRNFGLHFMRERAELMGSTLQIESRQGEGTRILLRLPAR